MDRRRIGALFVVLAAVAAVMLLVERSPDRDGSRATGHPAADTRPSPEAHPMTVPPSAAPESRIRPAASAGGGAVRGSVVDEIGAPVAGATVSVGDQREVRSDDAGRFEAAGLEGPDCDLVAEAPGFARKALRGVRLEAGRAVDVTMTLAPSPERVGRVLAPDGTPVAGAAVTINFHRLGAAAPTAPDPDVTRTTDEHGWFSFSPPEGRGPTFAHVRASKDGVGAALLMLEAFERSREVLEVRLQTDPLPEPPAVDMPFAPPAASSDATAVVEGQVRDAAGHPVGGAFVRAGHPSKGIETTADSEGRFRLLGVRAFGICRVGAARGRGPPTWAKHFPLAPGEIRTGVEIVLSADPDLVVDVIGADGRRAAAIAVTVEAEDSSDPASTRVTARTDASGRATFVSVPSTRVRVGVDPASLPPGVGTDPDESYSVGLLMRFEAVPVVVRLRPEVVFRGQVVLEDGSPVAGGTITFRIPEAPRHVRPMQTQPLFEPQAPERYRHVDRFARSNARGEFGFRSRSVDPYEFGVLTRVLRRANAAPELQIFEPVARTPLSPDHPTVVVVRKRGE